jgi:antitoxin HicB
MRHFIYDALFQRASRGRIVVSFPDVPEALAEGLSEADVRATAESTLSLALLAYPRRGLALPKRRARGKGLVPIAVAPDTAAKLALIEAFRAAGIAKCELARRLRKDEREIRRMLDPRCATKLPALITALRVLGQRLVIGIDKVA